MKIFCRWVLLWTVYFPIGLIIFLYDNRKRKDDFVECEESKRGYQPRDMEYWNQDVEPSPESFEHFPDASDLHAEMRRIWTLRKHNNIGIGHQAMANTTAKKKYLIALPPFPNSNGFCHPTILVSAVDESDAVSIVRRLKPNQHIGDIKQVSY